MTTAFGQSRSNRADIVQHFESPFIVIGFFTPDYAKAAADFAANLTEHRLSHHIYERPKIEGGPAKPTRVAMREVTEEVLTWDYGPAPAPEPAPEAPVEETAAP